MAGEGDPWEQPSGEQRERAVMPPAAVPGRMGDGNARRRRARARRQPRPAGREPGTSLAPGAGLQAPETVAMQAQEPARLPHDQ